MKLTKSLADLDAAADEILAKSIGESEDEDIQKSCGDVKKSEDNEPKANADDNEELEAGEVSENVPEEEVESAPETKEAEKPEEDVKKSMAAEENNGGDGGEVEKIEKCDANGDNLQKSDEDAAEAAAEEQEKADLEKSMKEVFEAEEPIKKSMDASEFLASVVEVLAKSMAATSFDMRHQSEQSSASNDVLAKSLQASLQLNKSMAEEISTLKQTQNDLVKSIKDGFEDLKAQMEEMSHQPAGLRKSVGNISVHDKNFHKSLTGQQGGVETLSKSEVLASLNNLMYSGNPLVTPTDIISYESGAPLRPEVAQLISSQM